MSGAQFVLLLNACGLMFAGSMYGISIINRRPVHAYLFSIGLHCICLLVIGVQMIWVPNV